MTNVFSFKEKKLEKVGKQAVNNWSIIGAYADSRREEYTPIIFKDTPRYLDYLIEHYFNETKTLIEEKEPEVAQECLDTLKVLISFKEKNEIGIKMFQKWVNENFVNLIDYIEGDYIPDVLGLELENE